MCETSPRRQRVRLDGVRAPYEDKVGVEDVLERVSGRARAEGQGKPRHRRPVANAGAVVDVVSLEGDPRPLLHDVAVLVRRPAGNLESQGLRPELLVCLLELARDEAEGLVPGGFHELVALLDERLGQPVRAVDELPAGGALGAKLALVYRAALVGLDADQPAVIDDEV